MSNELNNIVKRNNNEVYIGVVGPVRSGKSTFIRNFMNKKIIPNIKDDFIKNKVKDELPLSSDGKNIMTVETKFIPNSQLKVSTDDLEFNFRLVDCVGYIIPEAQGHFTTEGPKMVKTPWLEEEIPFTEAAELGTSKVINNHSNIGIVLTTDGTVTEFDRAHYINSEETVINKLKEIDKPFVIVLNTNMPNSEETRKLVNDLEDKYNNTVISLNCEELNESDIDRVLKSALEEYKINTLRIDIPSYINKLDTDNKIRQEFTSTIEEVTKTCTKMKDVYKIKDLLEQNDLYNTVNISDIDPSNSEVIIDITCKEELYNEIIEEVMGCKDIDKSEFLEKLIEYKKSHDCYQPYKDAIEQVNQTGYSISYPKDDSLVLDKPEIIKQGSRYGVKLQAKAPSIHLIKVDVDSTFEPIIGSEEQSKKLIDNLISNNDNYWETKVFGRSLGELVNDGVKAKLFNLTEYAQERFRSSLEKVVNNGKGGMIAIIL